MFLFSPLVLLAAVLVSSCCFGEQIKSICPSLIGNYELFPLPSVLNQQQSLSSISNCPMEWKNKDHIWNKFRDRIQKGEKQFFRLRLPVVFNGTTLRYVTVVWITSEFQYMLHFPQNFQTLSLGTMSIISENLRNNHIDWRCPPNCTMCGLGKRDLQDLLVNLTSSNDKYNWKYLCTPVSYGMEHILDEYPLSWSGLNFLNSQDFALPDTLYYWHFFKNLFVSRRPPLGIPSHKEDFPNYYCYNKTSQCVVKELLMKYFIIVYTAIIMWCYLPLLVYYMPSSSLTSSHDVAQGMLPSYKSPVHFTHFLQKYLCYRVKDHSSGMWWKIRLRRFALLVFLFSFSFRLLVLSDYRVLSWFFVVVVTVAALLPSYLSKSIRTEVPKCFPLFPNSPYPKGLIKWNDTKEKSREFQRLAYVMQERILLVFDFCCFWHFIITNSFALFDRCIQQRKSILRIIVSFLVGILTLLVAVSIILTYFLVPLLFFCKEMLCATWEGSKEYYRNRQTTCGLILATVHAICMICLFTYSLIVLLTISQMFNNFAMFLYIGAVLTPSMALEYVTLLAAVTTTLVTMIVDLQNGYDRLLQVMADVLNDDIGFKTLEANVRLRPDFKLTLTKDSNGVHVFKVNETIEHCHLLTKDTFTTSVSKKLYFDVIEQYRPINRQIGLIIVKMLLTLYFIGIAMWIKNVFHIESKVSSIFELASKVAIYFLPTVLEFLVYRGQFGQKSEVLLKQELITAIMQYLENMSQNL